MSKGKRMISNTIIEHDAFLELPHSAMVLYIYLNMGADDEGFVGNAKAIMRKVRASDDDMKILLAKRYVLSFESGVVVIKHWLIHNTIRQDRIVETTFLEEKSKLALKENLSYTEIPLLSEDKGVRQVSDTCPPNNTNLILTNLSNNSNSFKEEVKEIIDYLNKKLGTRYRYDNTANLKFIKGRIDEGATVEDFYKVIDVKYDDWIGTEYEKFLRPQTLFNKTNFEGYLNQKRGSNKNTSKKQLEELQEIVRNKQSKMFGEIK